jgi:glutathione S-transferase
MSEKIKKIVFLSVLKTVKYVETITHRSSLNLKSETVLMSIPFSHFSERARWLLDLLKVPYTEEMHGPYFHMSRTLLDISKYPRLPLKNKEHLEKTDEKEKKFARQKELSGVPKLLIRQDNSGYHVIPHGSHGIYQYYYETHPGASFLYPRNISKSLIHSYEQRLEKDLAFSVTFYLLGNLVLPSVYEGNDNVALNKFFFSYYLANQKNLPWIERALYRYCGNSFIKWLWFPTGFLTRETAVKSKQKILTVLNEMEELLKQSKTRYFLDATSPSSLDLSFAAFLFPVLLPNELKDLYWSNDEFVEKFPNTIGKMNLVSFRLFLLENYQCCRSALELYKEHRGISSRI